MSDITRCVCLPAPEGAGVVDEVAEQDGAGDASDDAGDHGLEPHRHGPVLHLNTPQGGRGVGQRDDEGQEHAGRSSIVNHCQSLIIFFYLININGKATLSKLQSVLHVSLTAVDI